MLYRLCYARKGQIAGVTFSAADLMRAVQFSELWERLVGCPVLTLKPLGESKFGAPTYTRLSRQGPAAEPGPRAVETSADFGF